MAIEIIDADTAVSLIISDLAMPGMNGHALLREVQQRRPGLPAILLTGYAGDELAPADPLTAATYSVLHKPITGAQLSMHVTNILK